MPQTWQSVRAWTLLGPLALTGAAGGSLWVYLSEGVVPGVALDSGPAELLYAWWVPGLLIGIAFTATLRFEPHEALAFSTLTGGIYFCCVGLSLVLANIATEPWGPSAMEGAVAGGVGAWLFHGAVLVFLEVRVRIGALSVVGVGALLGGIVSRVLGTPGSDRLAIVLVSAGWATAVGFASFVVAASSDKAEGQGQTGRRVLRDVLGGPIVQAIGVVATLASVVSLLRVLV